MQKTTLAVIVASGLAAVALGGVWWVTTGGAGQCDGTGLVGGDLGGPFTLVDETGQTVTDQDVITKPTILYFGYTFCPDVCPIDAMRNAVAADILAEQGVDIGTAFVTIDPARDTPEVLAAYTENFHPDMMGLTGDAAQIDAVAKAYRVFYTRADDDPEFYLMNHSVFSYLVTPDQGFVDFFRREDSPEQIAQRVGCLL